MAEIKALFFDQDGVIVDTERDGHRVAFNMIFEKMGYKFDWSVQEYHALLQVAGGKERMRHYLHTKGFGVDVPADQEDELIKKMHKMKTDAFISLIEDGALPLRPGVHRMMQSANNAGLTLGVCTTSNERAAKAVTEGMLSDIKFDFVLAGDVVSNKKPDPEIYNLALEKSGLKPDQCIVFEDSHNGVTAAKAAGMNVVATTNPYTEQEDLSAADIITSCLGDTNVEKATIRKGNLDTDGVITLEALIKCFA